MLHDEKKHFPTPTVNGNNVTAVTSTTLATSKVSPMWTKDDIDSLRKGIVSLLFIIIGLNVEQHNMTYITTVKFLYICNIFLFLTTCNISYYFNNNLKSPKTILD